MSEKQEKKPKVIVVCGPTAVGKTGVAIELALAFNGEIINADSRQIFRHMDIGTAKPTEEEQGKVRHHLVDVVEPDESFDARKFSKSARALARELISKGITPFVVGGTGLYIKAMLEGIFPSQPVDMRIRSRLKREVQRHGSANLHDRLKQADPDAARSIHPNDAYRIIRALEVLEITGKTITALRGVHKFKNRPFHALKIGLYMDRPVLYDRIDRRVDQMIREGLADEVEKLLHKGFGPELQAMQAIGYKQIADYFLGKLSWEDAVDQLKKDSRRYAKRQLTWFRADPDILWAKPDQIEQIKIWTGDFLFGS